MFLRILCLFFFTSIARGDDEILFPDQLEARLKQPSPRRHFPGRYDNSPSVGFVEPPRYDTTRNPCYYNRFNCPTIGNSYNSQANANANAESNGNGNSNAFANANSNSNSWGGDSSVKANAQASNYNGFSSSNAQASSQSQGNYGYNRNNRYNPYYPLQNNGGALSASSAASASASSGIVNGVPVAASSASAAAGGGGSSASATASASSSGNYGLHRRPINTPWFYASRIGGTDDNNVTTLKNENDTIIFDN
ncbi:hypothetical protein PV325_002165 [Microctonus aethiopoides]|nr:hypothetical protein PV325_002165 [Microctonus aethiopoides]